MATLRELLNLSPKEAARALVAKALRPGHDAKDLELTASEGLSTTRAFTINIAQKFGDVRRWRYKGTTPFTYDRLQWSDAFGDGVLTLAMDTPQSMSDITDYITKRFGVVFDENDVMQGPVHLADHGALTLLALPQSWRWFGTMAVYFKGAVDKPAVADEKPRVEDTEVQVINPTKHGFGDMLMKMRRGQTLGFNGRIWWNVANVAFNTPKKWVLDKEIRYEFNAGGGMVLFNGLAPDAPKHLNLGPNPRKVQIALHRNLCTGLKGLVTIYYSKP
jgi:hypothetical protein